MNLSDLQAIMVDQRIGGWLVWDFRGSNATLTIDLENQEIRGPDGGAIKFEIDPFRKHCLLNGLDDIGLTMEKGKSIDAFEAKEKAERPWL